MKKTIIFNGKEYTIKKYKKGRRTCYGDVLCPRCQQLLNSNPLGSQYVSKFGNPNGNKPVTMASLGRIMADYSV